MYKICILYFFFINNNRIPICIWCFNIFNIDYSFVLKHKLLYQ